MVSGQRENIDANSLDVPENILIRVANHGVNTTTVAVTFNCHGAITIVTRHKAYSEILV